MKHPKFITTLYLLAFILFLSNCVVPYESARMLPKGAMELKGSYTHASERFEGESASINDGLGFGFGYGVTDRINVKLRYERLFLSDSDGEGLNYIAFGPKFALIPDKLAVIFPFGAYTYDGESTWGVHPNLMATFPGKNNKFEATVGARTDIFFEEGADMLIGLNLGLGISQDLDRWAVRPDFGLVFNPGEDGVLLTFGVGFSYNIIPGGGNR